MSLEIVDERNAGKTDIVNVPTLGVFCLPDNPNVPLLRVSSVDKVESGNVAVNLKDGKLINISHNTLVIILDSSITIRK